MTTRLGFFYLAMTAADIASSSLAYGILHMRGAHGLPGWRWLFLIEGAFTLCIGLASFVMMPAGPTETAGNLRGKAGWFTERCVLLGRLFFGLVLLTGSIMHREEEIMVNRIIRDDENKGSMHNRQPVTPELLWRSLGKFDLW